MRSVWIQIALLAFLGACSRGSSAPRDEARGEMGDRGPSAADLEDAGERLTALAIPAGAPLVAFLGDSFAAGLHVGLPRAFPAVAQRLLVERGRPFRLLNAGVSGDTSAGGLSRVDWILAQKPDVLVVELGGNDGLRGQDVAGIESNLRAIVARAKAADVRVLLLGIQMPPSYGAAYCESFAAIYPRIARDLDVELEPRFLDGVGGVAEMILDDGLHPTRAGHERLAANVVPSLERVLDALARDAR